MILNRPYADTKRIHLGFSVGMNFQNLAITNNGHVTDDGEEWYADVPAHSPGFSVNVLADYRIAEHFNLRVSPGLYFGNKVVRFLNHRGDPELPDQTHYKQSQNVKSTYIVVPVDLKMSAKRYHNMRPYFTTGVMYAGDLAKVPPPPEASIGQVLAIVPSRFGDKNAHAGTFTCKSGRGKGKDSRNKSGNDGVGSLE